MQQKKKGWFVDKWGKSHKAKISSGDLKDITLKNPLINNQAVISIRNLEGIWEWRFCVCLFSRSRFPLLFFFFWPAFVDFGGQILLLWTVNILFMHCADTVHILKNIKNRSHGTIYTFKNYFATVFSVFSFSNNKLNPNGPLINYPSLSRNTNL